MVKGQTERHSELGRQGNIAFASYLYRKEQIASVKAGSSDSYAGNPYAEGLSLFDSAKDDLFYYQELDSYESRFNRLRSLIPVFYQGEKVRYFIQEISPHLMVLKQELNSQADWKAIERSCGFLAHRFPLNPRFTELQQVATENLSLQETVNSIKELESSLARLMQDGRSPIFYESEDSEEDDLISVLLELDGIPLPVKGSHPSHQYYYKEIETTRQSILDSGVGWIRRELEIDCRQADFNLAFDTLREIQQGLSACTSIQLPPLLSLEREIIDRGNEYRRLVDECESLIRDGKVVEARNGMARLTQLAPDNRDVPKLEEELLQVRTDALIRQYHQWFAKKQYPPILQSLGNANEGQILLSNSQRRVWQQKVQQKIKRQRTKKILIAACVLFLIVVVSLFVAYPSLFFRVTEFVSHSILGVENHTQTELSEQSKALALAIPSAIAPSAALLSASSLRRRSLEAGFKFQGSCFPFTYLSSRLIDLPERYLTSQPDLRKVRNTNLRLLYTPKDDSITEAGTGGKKRRLSFLHTL